MAIELNSLEVFDVIGIDKKLVCKGLIVM